MKADGVRLSEALDPTRDRLRQHAALPLPKGGEGEVGDEPGPEGGSDEAGDGEREEEAGESEENDPEGAEGMDEGEGDEEPAVRDEADEEKPGEEEAALRDGELRSLKADSVSFKGHCVMTDLTLNLVGQSAGPKAIKIRAAFSVFKDGSVGLIGTN